MKKKLLFAAFAMLCAGSSFALENGDYAFTYTQRLKITGDNIVQNGNFANATEGWTDAEGAALSADVWDFAEGVGPNGENAIQAIGSTAGAALCRSWQLADGGTYVVKYDIKGETTNAIRTSSVGGNYAAFFVNNDGLLTKGDDATIVSSEGYGYKPDWQTITYTFTAEQGQYLCMHFEQLTSGTMITNVEVYPAVEVYDIRKLERKLAYIDNLLESGAFTEDVVSEGGTSFMEMVGTFRSWVEANDPMLEEMDQVAEMVAEYDATLEAFLNANSADLLSGEKKWSAYGDERKKNSLGNWLGSGGRWFHKNNSGSNMITNDGDEIGHRLQGGMSAGAACMHYTVVPIRDGKIMFSLDILGHYMANTSSSWGNYVPDWNRDFKGVTFYGGPDTLWTDAAVIEASQNTKVDCGVISRPYAQTFTVIVDCKEGEPLTFGISYVPDPEVTGKYGSNVNIANPQLRLIGISQEQLDYEAEVVAITTQQAELVSRIATAKEKAAKAKSDGFPWGHDELNAAIEEAEATLEASYAYMKDGEVIDEIGIRDLLFTDGNTKESDVVLASVNAIKKAWEAYESLNASYTALVDIANEGQEMVDKHVGVGDAERSTALKNLVDEAKAMIEATGAESEKDAFDAKRAEIKDAIANYWNSYAYYAEPSPQTMQSPNPETGSATGWTFTENVSGKENFKRATQGAGWRAGYYTAVWRGNTVSPQSKSVQVKTLTDPGVYGFMVNGYAANEDFSKHLGMATIIDADAEAGVVADTIYNKSEVKFLFGLNGAPDSTRVVSRLRLATGDKNSGAGSGVAGLAYDACQYVVYYAKTDSEPVEVEFGMSSYGQLDGAGANTYGFGDTELFYYGDEAKFRKDMVDDMTKRIAACQDLLNSNLVLNEETGVMESKVAEAALWVSRMQRRLVDANNNLKQTETMKDLTELANSVFFIEQIAAKLEQQTSGIEGVYVNNGVRSAVQGVYTISGLRMSDDVQNLQPGLYIINGKKYIVK